MKQIGQEPLLSVKYRRRTCILDTGGSDMAVTEILGGLKAVLKSKRRVRLGCYDGEEIFAGWLYSTSMFSTLTVESNRSSLLGAPAFNSV
jgi:hypothetical protein